MIFFLKIKINILTFFSSVNNVTQRSITKFLRLKIDFIILIMLSYVFQKEEREREADVHHSLPPTSSTVTNESRAWWWRLRKQAPPLASLAARMRP